MIFGVFNPIVGEVTGKRSVLRKRDEVKKRYEAKVDREKVLLIGLMVNI
jgi:hypothetical protein